MGRMTTYVSDVRGTRTDINRKATYIRSKRPLYFWALVVFISACYQLTAQTTFGPTDPVTDVQMNTQDGSQYTHVNILQITSGRITYIKYDLTGVSGTINTATIDVRPASYNGAATFKISSGSHSNWSATNTTGLPTPVTELATFTSIGGSWSPVTINLSTADSSVYTGGTLTLIIEHLSGNTFGIARVGNNNPTNLDPKLPKLTLQYTPGSTNDTPTEPTNVSATDNGNGTASLSWTASTDNDGIANYKIFADENADGGLVEIGTSTTTSFTTGALNTSAYLFRVSAVDNSNDNLESDPSANSNTVTITNGSGGGGGAWTQTGSDLSYTTGDVGIGTAPHNGYMLSVAGNIISEQVKVQLQGQWPDYVFTDEYELPTLDEVRQHISEHGHLINIPSAEETEAEGIDLGEMNKLLLEKVEELTLYVLQQDIKRKQLETRLKELEGQN